MPWFLWYHIYISLHICGQGNSPLFPKVLENIHLLPRSFPFVFVHLANVGRQQMNIFLWPFYFLPRSNCFDECSCIESHGKGNVRSLILKKWVLLMFLLSSLFFFMNSNNFFVCCQRRQRCPQISDTRVLHLARGTSVACWRQPALSRCDSAQCCEIRITQAWNYGSRQRIIYTWDWVVYHKWTRMLWFTKFNVP